MSFLVAELSQSDIVNESLKDSAGRLTSSSHVADPFEVSNPDNGVVQWTLKHLTARYRPPAPVSSKRPLRKSPCTPSKDPSKLAKCAKASAPGSPTVGKTASKTFGGVASPIIPTSSDVSLSSDSGTVRADMAGSRSSRRHLNTASLISPVVTTPVPKASTPRSLTKATSESSKSKTEPPSRKEGDYPAAYSSHASEDE
uniref:Uncharacterized protein n=1 Tax=Peronospora matthiolae TaxID=2874970 RepID=A0AAV1V0V2_9STRA